MLPCQACCLSLTRFVWSKPFGQDWGLMVKLTCVLFLIGRIIFMLIFLRAIRFPKTVSPSWEKDTWILNLRMVQHGGLGSHAFTLNKMQAKVSTTSMLRILILISTAVLNHPQV